jgi:hypothetical protein
MEAGSELDKQELKERNDKGIISICTRHRTNMILTCDIDCVRPVHGRVESSFLESHT